MSDPKSETAATMWTFDCPDPRKPYPWVLRRNGVPVDHFASSGSAYNAMMRLRGEQENADAENQTAPAATGFSVAQLQDIGRQILYMVSGLSPARKVSTPEAFNRMIGAAAVCIVRSPTDGR